MRKLARTLFELQPILRLGECARFSQILPTCGRTQDMAITIDNGSRNVTQAQVNGAARRTYADYPEIRKSGNPSSIGAQMTDYVEITLHRNLGWPWPDDSWGLTPMFGADGGCHACGVPRHEQTGSIILRQKGFETIAGGWVPN